MLEMCDFAFDVLVFDTTFKRVILNNLHELGYRGRMAHFLEGFLESRTFKVCAGSTYLDTFKQEIRVPQGSILSSSLLNVQINDKAKADKEIKSLETDFL